MNKTKQIDETDSKILTTLLLEARTSFTDLARSCDISVTAVIRRYTRLKKTGIIIGEHMYLNPLSVGYESIAEIGILTDSADKEKVAQALRTKPSVSIGPSPLGKYDIYGRIQARKLSELAELVQQVDIKPYVKSLDVLIFADLWDNPWHPENLKVRSLERENENISVNRPKKTFEHVPLDEVDRGIIRALMENSRVAFSEVAQKLSISTANVIERYHFLREKNVINLSSISVDVFKLGYHAIADSYIKVVNRGTLPEVESELLKIPNLTFCAKFVGGAYDLRTAVIVSDFNDVFNLKKRLIALKNIKKAEFYLFGNPGPWPNDFIGQGLI